MQPKSFIYGFSSVLFLVCFFFSFALVVHSDYFFDKKIPVRGVNFLMGSDLDLTPETSDFSRFRSQPNSNQPQFSLFQEEGSVDFSISVFIMFILTILMIVSTFVFKDLIRDVIIFSASILLFIIGIVFNMGSAELITTNANESEIEGGIALYVLLLVSLFLVVYSLIQASRKREPMAKVIESNNLFEELK